MVNIMKCTHCNLNFDSQEDLFKHFRTPEHDDNINEDESDDEDCSSQILLKRQNDKVKDIDKKYMSLNAGFTADDYIPLRKVLALLSKEKKILRIMIFQYMDDNNIGRINNKICRCGKEFSSTESLIDHQLNCKYIEDTECNLCGKRFSDQYIFKTHLKKCIPKVDKKFKCKYCPKSYDYLGSLQRHLNICKKKPAEQPKQKKEFACEFCPKSYGEKSSLDRHLKKCTVFKEICIELEKEEKEKEELEAF